MMNMMDLDEAINEVEEMGIHAPTLSTDSDNEGGGVSVSPTATHASYPKVITLNVGGRNFQTLSSTLRAESGLFRIQLSEHFTWEPEPNGSYFLDADPGLFEHLLRFMRRPSVFPIFYTRDSGFNYDLYNRLEVEAEYFQMPVFHAWLKEKKYLKALVTYSKAPYTETIDNMKLEKCNANESLKRYTATHTRKTYVCPREIVVHRGAPHKCGAACHKAQGNDESRYEDEAVVDVVTAKNEEVFVGSNCRV